MNAEAETALNLSCGATSSRRLGRGSRSHISPGHVLSAIALLPGRAFLLTQQQSLSILISPCSRKPEFKDGMYQGLPIQRSAALLVTPSPQFAATLLTPLALCYPTPTSSQPTAADTHSQPLSGFISVTMNFRTYAHANSRLLLPHHCVVAQLPRMSRRDCLAKPRRAENTPVFRIVLPITYTMFLSLSLDRRYAIAWGGAHK